MKKKKIISIVSVITIIVLLAMSISVRVEGKHNEDAMLPGKVTVACNNESGSKATNQKNIKYCKGENAAVANRVLNEKYPKESISIGELAEENNTMEDSEEESEGDNYGNICR